MVAHIGMVEEGSCKFEDYQRSTSKFYIVQSILNATVHPGFRPGRGNLQMWPALGKFQGQGDDAGGTG